MVFLRFCAIVTGMNVEWKTEKNNLIDYEYQLVLLSS